MTPRLYAELTKAIQVWLDTNVDADDWPADVIVGDNTGELMALAARAVFDACRESQAYAIREGFMKVAP